VITGLKVLGSTEVLPTLLPAPGIEPRPPVCHPDELHPCLPGEEGSVGPPAVGGSLGT